LRLPAIVAMETCGMAPPFLWQSPRPEPAYHHKALHDFFAGSGMRDYLEQQTFDGMIFYVWKKIKRLATWYFSSWGLAVPLVMLPWLLKRDGWMRLGLLIVGLFLGALLLETWTQAHYAAPVMALVFAISLEAMRQLYDLRWQGWSIGRWMAQTCVGLCLVAGVIEWVGLLRLDPGQIQWYARRAQIVSYFKKTGSKRLIIVRYSPDQNPPSEWVYNEADIDNAAVVWAREMDEEHNRKLLNYFRDRSAWLLDVGAWRITLVPYQVSSSTAQNRAALQTNFARTP